jgi:hypothetical protein
MAMTFTLATAAREALSALLEARKVREQEEDDARTKAYEEVGGVCSASWPGVADTRPRPPRPRARR